MARRRRSPGAKTTPPHSGHPHASSSLHTHDSFASVTGHSHAPLPLSGEDLAQFDAVASASLNQGPESVGGVRPLVVNVSGPALELTKQTHYQRFRNWFEHEARNRPARLALTIFALIIGVVTVLLSLPFSARPGVTVSFVDALFTATSAVCVTGLTSIDTAESWSAIGQAVLALSIVIGGLGVMTLASILGFAVSRHIGLTQRMLTAQEHSSGMGQVGALLRAVIGASLIAEGLLFFAFLPSFVGEGKSWRLGIWDAFFMAISVFNNAGFVVIPGGLAQYQSDWMMLIPILVGTAVGAIGFPVINDIATHWREPRRWSLHTKLTLTTYGIIAVVGAVLVGMLEWNNPDTMARLHPHARILNSLLSAVNSRSSGLSALNVGDMYPQTHFVNDLLMMIGGGSASTAGGIKVTTFAVLMLAVVAEARGDRDIETFKRRIPQSVVRLAVAVTLLGSAMVSVATILLLAMTHMSLDLILFEVISAFATVGLSTGITPLLPVGAKYVLILLMFAGRTGTMTMAAALAMRERRRVIRMPEERPIIG